MAVGHQRVSEREARLLRVRVLPRLLGMARRGLGGRPGGALHMRSQEGTRSSRTSSRRTRASAPDPERCGGSPRVLRVAVADAPQGEAHVRAGGGVEVRPVVLEWARSRRLVFLPVPGNLGVSRKSCLF